MPRRCKVVSALQRAVIVLARTNEHSIRYPLHEDILLMNFSPRTLLVSVIVILIPYPAGVSSRGGGGGGGHGGGGRGGGRHGSAGSGGGDMATCNSSQYVI